MQKIYKIAMGLFFIGLHITPVMADEIVMTTGESFISSDIWRDGDKIRFNMQGLVVSVDRSDVARINRQNRRRKEDQQANDANIKALPFLHASNSADDPTDNKQSPYEKKRRSNFSDNPEMPQPNNLSRTSLTSEKNGIGIAGVTWQMPHQRLTDLEKIETDPAFGGIDQYWQPAQPLAFTGTPVDGMVYGFWRDQLYSIMMWADGRIGYKRLKQTVFRHFGPGSQNEPQSERFVWDGEQTQRMLEFDAERNTGIFVMRSTALDKKIKAIYPSLP